MCVCARIRLDVGKKRPKRPVQHTFKLLLSICGVLSVLRIAFCKFLSFPDFSSLRFFIIGGLSPGVPRKGSVASEERPLGKRHLYRHRRLIPQNALDRS